MARTLPEILSAFDLFVHILIEKNRVRPHKDKDKGWPVICIIGFYFVYSLYLLVEFRI